MSNQSEKYGSKVYRPARELGIPEDQVEARYFGHCRTLTEFGQAVIGDLGPATYPEFEFLFQAVTWSKVGRYFLKAGQYVACHGYYFATEGS